MKKRLSLFILSFYLISMISCFTASAMKMRTVVDVPTNLLVLGDSIAAGYGLDGYDKSIYDCSSYANLLHKQYDNELSDYGGNVMVNKAVSGDTSEQLLNHINSGEFDKELKKSNVILVSIGGNDILGIFLSFIKNDLGISMNSSITDIMKKAASGILTNAESISNMSDKIDKALNTFGTNLDSITDAIKKRSNGHIIMQTLYNPFRDFTLSAVIANLAEKKLSTFNSTINSHSEKNGVKNYDVCDVYTKFGSNSAKLTNMDRMDIHPNADGHVVIAACADKVIRSHKYLAYTEIPDDESNSSTKPDRDIVIMTCTTTGGIITLVSALLFFRSRNKDKD